MITSIEAENLFGKIKYLFMISNFSKPGIEKNFLNLIKNIYEKANKIKSPQLTHSG